MSVRLEWMSRSRPLSWRTLLGVAMGLAVACSCGGGDPLVDEAEKRYRENDLDGALALFEQALDRDPDLPAAYYGIGVIHYTREQPAAALEPLRRAVALAPESAEYRMVYADTLAGLGRYDDAIAEYETALALSPGLTRAYYSIGIAYYNKRSYEESVRWLRRYLSEEPRAANRDQIYQMIRVLED